MENVESTTTHLDGVNSTQNLSYAQILTQIANFYHNLCRQDVVTKYPIELPAYNGSRSKFIGPADMTKFHNFY